MTAANRSIGCWSTRKPCWPPSTNAVSAIDALLRNVSAFSAQVQGFINDNPNLNPVLEQLRAISDVLVARKDDLAQTLTYVSQFAASLGESVASGPYFKIVLSNLLPYWMLQPFVDAAFKKRGIDPEDFWRSAGLPAFRWPDPNGTRFPNGAPPPAPPVLEGTPDHPGPAVPPGTACSYTPAARRPAAPLEPAAVQRCRRRPLRRQLPRTDRRADVAAEPQWPATDTGHPYRRPPWRSAPGRPRHTGAASRPGAARGAHREPATRRPRTPAVDLRARPAAGATRAARTRAAAAGAVHQPRRHRGQRRNGR